MKIFVKEDCLANNYKAVILAKQKHFILHMLETVECCCLLVKKQAL